MDFVPFQPPQSEHHMLNTGLSTEGGVTAKGLVDGLNSYIGHLFDRIKELEQRFSPAPSTPQASTIAEDLKQAATMLADAKVAPAVETATQAVKRITAEGIAKAKGARTTIAEAEASLSKNSLADVLAGLK